MLKNKLHENKLHDPHISMQVNLTFISHWDEKEAS